MRRGDLLTVAMPGDFGTIQGAQNLVMPADAGIQTWLGPCLRLSLDSRFRGNDAAKSPHHG
jgi:hypothetical protein